MMGDTSAISWNYCNHDASTTAARLFKLVTHCVQTHLFGFVKLRGLCCNLLRMPFCWRWLRIHSCEQSSKAVLHCLIYFVCDPCAVLVSCNKSLHSCLLLIGRGTCFLSLFWTGLHSSAHTCVLALTVLQHFAAHADRALICITCTCASPEHCCILLWHSGSLTQRIV